MYHGQQDTGNVCNDTAAGVSMYPTEYLTHGVGYTGAHEDVSQVIIDASGNKQYRISDHLATLRATVDGSGISSYDSDPWGGTLEAPMTGESRRVFNDREKDRETGDLNLGVRSEEPGLGRFTSIDPLWEKFPNQSPYVYADNNPLRMTDPSGMQAGEIFKGFMKGFFVDGPLGVVQAALDQGKFIACPPCAFYQQAKDAVNPETYTRMWQGLGSLTGDPVRAAEFGGKIGFDLLLYKKLGDLTTISEATGLNSSASLVIPINGETGAHNAADGVRLAKSLASEAQMSERGFTLAGAGRRVPFRDAGRVASQYGGAEADWVKKTSGSYTASDGSQFETHWVENILTGQRVEFKVKFSGGQ